MAQVISVQLPRNQARGFTLLEVMIAMAIFTIGILAVIGGQHLIIQSNTDGNVMTEQLMLAQRTMERLKNGKSPQSLSISGEQTDIDADGSSGGPYTVEYKAYNAFATNATRFIKVTVSKKGPGGHTVEINSLTYGEGI